MNAEQERNRARVKGYRKALADHLADAPDDEIHAYFLRCSRGYALQLSWAKSPVPLPEAVTDLFTPSNVLTLRRKHA